MVVEENNSSPMTEITSRTELDVIEEAENELTEREDEWIKARKEKARVEYCMHVFSFIWRWWRGGSLQQFFQVLTRTLFYRTNVSTGLQSLHYPRGTVRLYGVEWADLHVYIKCTPALFKLRHFYRRLPEFLFFSLWTFSRGKMEKECITNRLERCFNNRPVICWTLTLRHTVFLLYWDAQWIVTVSVYYKLLRRNIFYWLVAQTRFDSIFQLIYFCIHCTNVVYFANVTSTVLKYSRLYLWVFMNAWT